MTLQISGSDCSSVWGENTRRFYQSADFRLQREPYRVVAVLLGGLAKADPAPPSQHRLLAAQVHFARLPVHEQECAVGGKVGGHEISVARLPASLQPGGEQAHDHD